MLSHLGALVPGQRAPQLLRQEGDCSGDGVPNGLCAMAGQCGAVLHTGDVAVTFHARQMQQNREARRSLDQRADRGTSQAQDQVTLPMTRNRPIVGFLRPLADHDLRGNEGLAPPPESRPRHPQRSAGAQASGQFAGAARLDPEHTAPDR